MLIKCRPYTADLIESDMDGMHKMQKMEQIQLK